jgi:hypothetical protein
VAERFGQTRQESYLPKQEQISLLTNVRKHLDCELQLKMSSREINAPLDTSQLGPPHPFKDAGVVADSVTGFHIAVVKCLFVVNRSCIHKGCWLSPQVKIQRFEIWWSWRPCSGSSAYPSVMTGNISHSTRAPSCMHHIRALTACGTIGFINVTTVRNYFSFLFFFLYY